MYICKTARFKSYISAEGKIMPCMGYSCSSIAGKFPSILEISLAEITTNSFYKDITHTTKSKFLEKNKNTKVINIKSKEFLKDCLKMCENAVIYLEKYVDDLLSRKYSFQNNN